MSSQGSNQLTVSWKDTCSYEKGFIIERADASRVFSIIGRTDLNVPQFTDPNVDSSKQYYLAETEQIQLSADGHYLYSAGWNAVQKWEVRNEWKVVM